MATLKCAEVCAARLSIKDKDVCDVMPSVSTAKLIGQNKPI